MVYNDIYICIHLSYTQCTCQTSHVLFYAAPYVQVLEAREDVQGVQGEDRLPSHLTSHGHFSRLRRTSFFDGTHFVESASTPWEGSQKQM